MKLSGVNTYDSTQIDDSQSQYNLNCFNREGVLKARDHSIKFAIPKLPVYEREYSCVNAGSDTTSDDVSRDMITYEYDGEEYVSGIVKPKVSLFIDTTKYEVGTSDDNYLRKASDLRTNYGTSSTGGIDTAVELNGFIGDELFNAMDNFGRDCEVYKDVEIAVSYSGAYGESGLTKFRLTNNILHFFTCIHDISKYKNNPNYKYVNVYVRYGSYTELVLLHKLEIEELLAIEDGKFDNGPINIRVGDSPKQFYTSYYNDELLKTGIDPLYSYNVLGTNPTDNMVGSSGEINTIIYSGLFQFENAESANPSWFVSNAVSPVAPLANVETQTYLSSEDYTIQDEVNKYLDEAYNLADNLLVDGETIPLLTSDSHFIKYVDNDALNITSKVFEWDHRAWINNKPSVAETTPGAFNNAPSSNNQILDNTIYDPSIFYQNTMSDAYNGAGLSDKSKAKTSYGGSFIIQYYSKHSDDTVTLINTTEIVVSAAKYSIFTFKDLVSKLTTLDPSDEDYQEWIIDIWYNPSTSTDTLDVTYRVMSINVNDAWDNYVNTLGLTPPSMLNQKEVTSYGISNCVHLYNGGEDPPIRDYGFVDFNDSLETIKTGLVIVVHAGMVANKPEFYMTSTLIGDGITETAPQILTDDSNFTDDISTILSNSTGRYDNSYNTFKDGILKSPQFDYVASRVRTSLLENYDGRLFTVNKENVEGVEYDYIVDEVMIDNFDSLDPYDYDLEYSILKQYTDGSDDVILVNSIYDPVVTYTVKDVVYDLPLTVDAIGDNYIQIFNDSNAVLQTATVSTSSPVWVETELTTSDWILVEGTSVYLRYIDSELGYFTVISIIPKEWTFPVIYNSNTLYDKDTQTVYRSARTGTPNFTVYEGFDRYYKDLYYSEQGYPEMILETNYKGYDRPITGLKAFIEQLYVFQDTQIDVVKKSLTREVSGIIEPTYQYHKSYDKGAIEYTIKEYEKKLFFTNNEGIFYIDAGGNYNKASADINRLFYEGYLNTDTIGFAEIKDEFYTLKLRKKLQMGALSDLTAEVDTNLESEYIRLTCPVCGGDGFMYGTTTCLNCNGEGFVNINYAIPYAESSKMAIDYISYHIPSGTFWFGNDKLNGIMWFYQTKDFTKRNQYENIFKKKQLKRISLMYSGGEIKVSQVRNKSEILGNFWYPNNYTTRPVRHTLKGNRNFMYGFLFGAKWNAKVLDFAIIDNGK